MATNMEMQKADRSHLYSLLKLKKVNKGIEIKELNALINQVESTMQAEDVAYVEKKVAQLAE